MAEIKILVKCKTDSLEFMAPESTTVEEFTKMVAEKIKNDKFELKQGLINLLPDKPVSKYYENGEFQVSFQKHQVTVDINGKTHDIEATSDMTVTELKEAYKEASTISANEEILTFNGKVMEDADILGSFEITDGSKIFGLICSVQVKYKKKCLAFTVPRTLQITGFREKVANKIKVKCGHFNIRQSKTVLKTGPINDYLGGPDFLVDMKKFYVNVDINCKSCRVPVTADLIVSQFKLEVDKVSNTSIDGQKFRCNGKEMDGDKILAFYDIEEGSEIIGMLCDVFVRYKDETHPFIFNRETLVKDIKENVKKIIDINTDNFELSKELLEEQINKYLIEGQSGIQIKKLQVILNVINGEPEIKHRNDLTLLLLNKEVWNNIRKLEENDKKLELCLNVGINGQFYRVPFTDDMTMSQFKLEVDKVSGSPISDKIFTFKDKNMDGLIDLYDILDWKEVIGIKCDVKRTLDKTIFLFIVDRQAIVKDIIKHLANDIKMPIDKELHFNVVILDDEPINKYLGDGNVFEVKMKILQVGCDFENRNYTLPVTDDMTVSQLKTEVCNKANISGSIALNFNSIKMENTDLLEVHEISENCKIYVIAELPGG